MQIHTVNAEAKLAGVASGIGRSPSSWRGWHALQIEFVMTGMGQTPESCLLWVGSILESYLKDVEGRAYFCFGGSLHIICKDVRRDILEQTADHIRDLVKKEDGLGAQYKIYALDEDGFDYVSHVFERQGDCRSFPVSKYSEAATFELLDALENGIEETNTMTIQGGARVLLVDDDPVTRWTVRNTLQHECELMTATSAHQAFSKFQAFQPDVVFLDIDLPDQNGREVLEWMVRNDPGVCVVMFSSNDNIDNISKTLEEGASGFIAKPFLKQDLMTYVRAYKTTMTP